MAQAAVGSSSQTAEVVTTGENQETLILKLHKPKNEKKVQWKEEVIDNEHMGKKKSKCCCIYMKPVKFDESDSESDSDPDSDDCCHEHRVARRRVPKQLPQDSGPLLEES